MQSNNNPSKPTLGNGEFAQLWSATAIIQRRQRQVRIILTNLEYENRNGGTDASSPPHASKYALAFHMKGPKDRFLGPPSKTLLKSPERLRRMSMMDGHMWEVRGDFHSLRLDQDAKLTAYSKLNELR